VDLSPGVGAVVQLPGCPGHQVEHQVTDDHGACLVLHPVPFPPLAARALAIAAPSRALLSTSALLAATVAPPLSSCRRARRNGVIAFPRTSADAISASARASQALNCS